MKRQGRINLQRATCDDPRLKFEHLGLLAWLATHDPTRFVVRLPWLRSRFSVGEEKLAGLLRDLEAWGHITREVARDAKGHKQGLRIHVLNPDFQGQGNGPAPNPKPRSAKPGSAGSYKEGKKERAAPHPDLIDVGDDFPRPALRVIAGGGLE